MNIVNMSCSVCKERTSHKHTGVQFMMHTDEQLQLYQCTVCGNGRSDQDPEFSHWMNDARRER